jgi:polyketide synthase PksM
VVEEYLEQSERKDPRPAPPSNDEELIVLSAFDEKQLKRIAERLREHIEKCPEQQIADIANTLQLGREALQSRVAWIVRDRRELQQALTWFIGAKEANDRELPIQMFAGAGSENAALKMLLDGRIGDGMLKESLTEGNLGTLALLWTQGRFIPWKHLHADRPKRIVRLPLYPFCRGESPGLQRTPQSEPLSAVDDGTAQMSSLANGDASVQEFVLQFATRELGVPRAQLSLTRALRDYGMDSLCGRQLIRNLEERFAIRVSGREAALLQTASDWVALVNTLRGTAFEESHPAQLNRARPATSTARVSARSAQSTLDAMTESLLADFERGKLNPDDFAQLLIGS